MLRSSNPVLSRRDAFTPGQSGHQFDDGMSGYRTTQQPGPIPPSGGTGRMTIDDVLTKTAVLLGVLVLTAGAAWMLVPPAFVYPALIGSGLIGFVLSFVVAIRRRINPVLAGIFAVVEGVFVGMLSMVFEQFYTGIVVTAVFSTMVAAGVTLAAYKFLNVRVRGLVAKVAMVGTIAFAFAMLANLGLSFVGVDLGLRAGVTGPVGWLPILVSGIAVVLCVLNLFLDFQYIENGIRMGAPANESWRAAFGLMVTLVWLYVELLRILSYFRRG
ncbi:MAG TPA: Bax inhibitor-1/YccA family protein, partial [Bacillota bacterium]|nr:Bax inhibitor-1/YccA family protein [Bacillota bacterium]